MVFGSQFINSHNLYSYDLPMFLGKIDVGHSSDLKG